MKSNLIVITVAAALITIALLQLSARQTAAPFSFVLIPMLGAVNRTQTIQISVYLFHFARCRLD